MQRLVRLYGAGLARLMGHVRELGHLDGALTSRLAGDELLASLLLLHDLHPWPVAERVRARAGRRARTAAVAHRALHLAGGRGPGGQSAPGKLWARSAPRRCCRSTALLVRALQDAAPEITQVAVEGLQRPGTATGRRRAVPDRSARAARASRAANPVAKDGPVNPLQPLARFAHSRRAPRPPPSDPCEMCGQPLDQGHRHVLEPRAADLALRVPRRARCCSPTTRGRGPLSRPSATGCWSIPRWRISDDLLGPAADPGPSGVHHLGRGVCATGKRPTPAWPVPPASELAAEQGAELHDAAAGAGAEPGARGLAGVRPDAPAARAVRGRGRSLLRPGRECCAVCGAAFRAAARSGARSTASSPSCTRAPGRWARGSGVAMRFTRARAVADAVLFEGYLLYPYRASAPEEPAALAVRRAGARPAGRRPRAAIRRRSICTACSKPRQAGGEVVGQLRFPPGPHPPHRAGRARRRGRGATVSSRCRRWRWVNICT